MEHIVLTDKVNFLQRFYFTIYIALCLLIVPVYASIQTPSLSYLAIMAIVVCGFIINRGIYYRRTYIYQINSDGNNLIIDYQNFNKEQQLSFDKENVTITFTKCRGKFEAGNYILKLEQENKPTLVQFSHKYWGVETMQEVYNELLAWKNKG